MRFLSLFSGIEAASIAWIPLGWECVAVAEIDRFACDLLKKRFPDVPNLGDVTKITREQIQALGHIDVVIAGFPCQDVSIAGKGAGFEDQHGQRTRSGLFHVARKLIRWSRARWTVIENVPGLFTSRSGRDFATVVSRLAGRQFQPPKGGWRNAGVAAGPLGLVEWATLDSQYFHVAQRRERVFIVRDSGAWADRPPVLLVRESGLGDPPSRAQARSGTSPRTSPCLRASSQSSHRPDTEAFVADVHAPLSTGTSQSGGGRRPGMAADDAAGLVAFVDLQNTRLGGDLAGTIDTSRPARGGGAGVIVPDGPVAVFRKSRRAQTKDDDETWVEDGRANTLNAFDVGERDTHAIVAPEPEVHPIDLRQSSRGERDSNERPGGSRGGPAGTGVGAAGDPAYTVTGRGQAVAYPLLEQQGLPDPAYALSSGEGCRFGSGRDAQDTFVVGPLCANGKAAGSATQQDAESGMLVAHTLRADGFDASEDGTGRGTPLVAVPDPTFVQPVSDPITAVENKRWTAEGCTFRTVNLSSSQYGVRRLTPTECERL